MLTSLTAMRSRLLGPSKLAALSAAVPTATRSLSSASGEPGVLEWRKYKISYGGLDAYMKLTEEAADLRKRLHPGWKGFLTSDTGGCLMTVHHMYHYDSILHRKEVREAASTDAEWRSYREAIGPYIMAQESSIFKPSVECLHAAGSPLLQDFNPEPEDEVMYELREYQLHPGYDSVPGLLKSFAKGLPHKVAADSNSKLVFFGFIDVGMLNSVVELWRYPSLPASVKARESARKVSEWKHCIASVTPNVQHFRTQALIPTKFSPLR